MSIFHIKIENKEVFKRSFVVSPLKSGGLSFYLRLKCMSTKYELDESQ